MFIEMHLYFSNCPDCSMTQGFFTRIIRLCKQLQTDTSSDIPCCRKQKLTFFDKASFCKSLGPKVTINAAPGGAVTRIQSTATASSCRPSLRQQTSLGFISHLGVSRSLVQLESVASNFQFLMISTCFYLKKQKKNPRFPAANWLQLTSYPALRCLCSSRFLASSKAKPPIAAWTVAFGVQAIAVKNFSCRKERCLSDRKE